MRARTVFAEFDAQAGTLVLLLNGVRFAKDERPPRKGERVSIERIEEPEHQAE